MKSIFFQVGEKRNWGKTFSGPLLIVDARRWRTFRCCFSFARRWKENENLSRVSFVAVVKFPPENFLLNFTKTFLPPLRHDDELHTCEYLMRCKFSIVVGVDQQPVIYFHIKLFESVGKSTGKKFFFIVHLIAAAMQSKVCAMEFCILKI